MTTTVIDVSQTENKNLSEDFLNALKELGEAIDDYKERVTKIKQSISKIIEIGRQNGISDILIGQYIRDTFEKRELSDSTIQRYLPEGLKRSYNKRNKNFKEIQSSLPVRVEDDSEEAIRIPVPSQTENVITPEIIYADKDLGREKEEGEKQTITNISQKFDVLESRSDLLLVADKDSEKDLKKQLKEVKQQFEQLRQQLKRKIRIKLDTSKCTNGEVLKLNVRSTNIFYFDLDVETKNITNYVTWLNLHYLRKVHKLCRVIEERLDRIESREINS